MAASSLRPVFRGLLPFPSFTQYTPPKKKEEIKRRRFLGLSLLHALLRLGWAVSVETESGYVNTLGLYRLKIDIDLTQMRVRRVGSLLREEFRVKGDDVAEELSDRLRSRKSWVEELEAGIPVATDEQLSLLPNGR